MPASRWQFQLGSRCFYPRDNTYLTERNGQPTTLEIWIRRNSVPISHSPIHGYFSCFSQRFLRKGFFAAYYNAALFKDMEPTAGFFSLVSFGRLSISPPISLLPELPIKRPF